MKHGKQKTTKTNWHKTTAVKGKQQEEKKLQLCENHIKSNKM